MDPSTTRRMEPADVPAVAALERQIFGDPWPELAFEREIEEVRSSWPRAAIDPESGDLLAYMVAWFVADEAHLANIAVAPLARRRGLAQRLLDDLVAESDRRGARMVLLEVRRSNHAAQAFYRKNGFYLVGVRHRYYRDNGEDALIMVKPLNESGRLPALEDLS